MINRRYLLKSFFIALSILTFQLEAQNQFDVFDYWSYLPNPSQSIYDQILDKALSQLEERRSTVSIIDDKENWVTRQKIVQEKLHRLLLPDWEKTPLNPIITGTLDRPEFKVEKLIFESFPDYPVSAAIFLPQNRKGKMPAILFCSGHSDEGFRSPVYQHMILNYVKKGFVVLAFDPVGQGERNQYFKEDGNKMFRPTHEHSYVGNQIFMKGNSPAEYFVWDGIRAIDYLVDRPEVDATRIGVTGRSGGGTQSAYLMAVDDRIAAAAPECFLTTFEYLLQSGGPQDAEQNIAHFLAEGLDLADLVEVRAPKPTLMVTTTRDIFSIQGARDLYQEAKSVYKVFNAEDALAMVEDDAPHQSTLRNREATYGFFQKYLNNPGSSEDEEVEIFDEQELWVTSQGQLYKDGYSETLFSVQKKMASNTIELTISKQAESYLKTLIDPFDLVKSQPVKYIYSGTTKHDGYLLEKYLLKINSDYFIPLVWLKPDLYSEKKLIVLVDEAGKHAHADSLDLIFDLLSAGYQIVLPDLSGYGEMSAEFSGDAMINGVPLNIWYAGVLTKKYPVAIRSNELLALNDFLSSKQQSIEIPSAIGIGTAAVDLLTAAALGVKYQSLILKDGLGSIKSLVNIREYPVKYIPSLVPGSLPYFDIDDLIKKCRIPVKSINPVSLFSEGGNLDGLKNDSGVKLEIKRESNPDKIKSEIIRWLNH